MKKTKLFLSLFILSGLLWGICAEAAQKQLPPVCAAFQECLKRCEKRGGKIACRKRCEREQKGIDLDKECGVPCGPVTCKAGQVCCNASCGICTEPGGFCIALHCSPKENEPNPK